MKNRLKGMTFALLLTFAFASWSAPVPAFATPSGQLASGEGADLAVQARLQPSASTGSPAAITLDVARASTGKLVLKKATTYKLAANASKGKIAYRSSKPKIATVTRSGVVKARQLGKTTITVTAKKGKQRAVKKVKVTVVAARNFKGVKSLKVKAAKRKLQVGGTTRISVTLSPKRASNKNVIYKSGQPKIASVSAAGVVTAKRAGTVKVTVKSCQNPKAKRTVTMKVVNPVPTLGTLEVDELNHIRGKAGVAVFTIPAKNSNAVQLSDGTASYAMHDDGKAGDAEANDGVFTYSYDTSQLQVQETAFRASAGSALSNYVSLFAFPTADEVSDSEVVEQRASASEAIAAAEFGCVDDAGYVDPEKAADVLNSLAGELARLKEDGTVAAYDVTDDGAYIKLACGIGMVYNPPIEGTSGSPAFEKSQLLVSAYEPCEDMTLKSQHAEGYAMSDFVSEIADADHLGGEGGRYYEGEEVSLEMVLSMPKNALLIWSGHGGYARRTGPTLVTGADYDSEHVFGGAYHEDCICDAIVLGLGKACITGKFIDRHYGESSFEDGIVFTTSCHGAQSSELADAFISKGAKSFVGFTDTVDIGYCLPVVLETINEMCMTKSTLALALAKVEGLYGSNDREWEIEEGFEKVKPERQAASPKIFGNENYMFVTATNTPSPDLTYADKRYRYIESGVVSAWEDAKTYCEMLGGHLATIASQEENDRLYSYIVSIGASNAYFGFSDAESEGDWKWVTDENISYVNWHSDEPNNESENEDYAMFYWKFDDGTWNDGNFGAGTVGDDTGFICEWDDEVLSDTSLPERERLEAFLLRMEGYHNGETSSSSVSSWEYDSRYAATYKKSVLANVVTRPAFSIADIDSGLYPVSIYLRDEDVQNDGSPKDPLGRFVQYAVCDAPGVEWLLKNIFNVGDGDYAVLQVAGDSLSGVGEYYLHDGKFYSRIGGVGSVNRGIDIVSWKKEGARYDVHFRLYSGMDANPGEDADGWHGLYAQVELKAIDGASYWSIYRLSESNFANLNTYLKHNA